MSRLLLPMPKPKRSSSAKVTRKSTSESKTVGLRIVGGKFRGRKLQYSGDLRVRPMKDRVREALFNLVGPSIKGKHALDLFGGTGALGLEALSRGAVDALFVECHYPTAAILKTNIKTIGVEDLCQVAVTDTFFWLEQQPSLSNESWVVFVSPPYEFFISRADDMKHLVDTIYQMAPPESILVVESDQRFDFDSFGDCYEWNLRNYAPARVGICRKPHPQ